MKPWDDETDMVTMEKVVREISTDGLLWGAAKLVPLAYGIHKLQISCVVEDDKVSIDWLTEEIEKLEDFVSEHLLYNKNILYSLRLRWAIHLSLNSTIFYMLLKIQTVQSSKCMA